MVNLECGRARVVEFPHKRFCIATIKVMIVLVLAGVCAGRLEAGLLTGSFSRVPEGSIVDLTAEGTVDWVHWGVWTEFSVTRKAGVTSRISDFELVYNRQISNAYTQAFHVTDHYNAFSWTDGFPDQVVEYTINGVWAYGLPHLGTGFKLSVPASSAPQRLKVYVGTFGARGRFVASLSDGSANVYQNTSLYNAGNGEGAVYTLDFAANSDDAVLEISWTLSIFTDPVGNVTLFAAALSSSEANNLPIATFVQPSHLAQFPEGHSIPVEVAASDRDGTVSLVEFFADQVKIGEDDSSSYTATWNNPSLGWHELTARVRDNQGAINTAPPVTVYVYDTGGELRGQGTNKPPATMNLTVEGTADWAHWGLGTNNLFNHKAGVPTQISPVVVLGMDPVERNATTNEFHPAVSWTDGTPATSAVGARTGIFQTGVDSGFEIRVPADRTLRRVKLLVGLYAAVPDFRAYLSDFSTPAFIDTAPTSTNVYASGHLLYTLEYRAASQGQSLILRHGHGRLYDFLYGNVYLQAVALADLTTELPLVLLNPGLSGGDFVFTFATEANKTYVVERIDELDPTLLWQTWSNIIGTGQPVTVHHPRGTRLQQFYRVRK